MSRPFGRNYAFIVAGAIFLALMGAAGLRAAPGVLMLPLEKAFGWDRGLLSAAAGLGIFLYGLTGPFAAALMQSFGLRRTTTLALSLLAVSAGLSSLMTEPWHYLATWGVMTGLGSGEFGEIRPNSLSPFSLRLFLAQGEQTSVFHRNQPMMRR